jgi:hypothetical protein
VKVDFDEERPVFSVKPTWLSAGDDEMESRKIDDIMKSFTIYQ